MSKPGSSLVTDPLPPAGDARREVLKERADRLEEAAEQLTASGDLNAVNPAAFTEIDPEIAQHFDEYTNECEVTDKRAGYVYCWVYAPLHAGRSTRQVQEKKYLGWHVVEGGDPECDHLRQADGCRRIGDTILMRTTQARYDELIRREEVKRRMREEGVDRGIAELNERALQAGGSIKPMSQINPRVAQAMQARSLSNQKLDQWIRQGQVPGMPAPGRGR